MEMGPQLIVSSEWLEEWRIELATLGLQGSKLVSVQQPLQCDMNWQNMLLIGRQGRMERYCCSVICGAPTTSKVKGLRWEMRCYWLYKHGDHHNWASSSDYGTYHMGDQQRLSRACACIQSRQSLRCSHTWSTEVNDGSDQKSDI